MAKKSFNLVFEGYWIERNQNGLKECSGVYCVYCCKYNQIENKVSDLRLIYIGEADNIRNRVINHERYDDWKSRLSMNEILCFSCSEVSESNDRKRCEAALIYYHKPPLNIEFKNNFPFDNTDMNLSGMTACLTKNFTTNRT